MISLLNLKLKDKDGDFYVVNYDFPVHNTISLFLRCTKTKAKSILKTLEKYYDVYGNYNSIFICKNKNIIYHFEAGGESYGTEKQPHKYNEVGVWDFRNFINKKIKPLKPKKEENLQPIITATEIQIKRMAQILYAQKLGFSVGYKDLQRFYIVE